MNASDFGFEVSNHGDGFEMQMGVMPAMASLVGVRVGWGCNFIVRLLHRHRFRERTRESKQMSTVTGVSRVQGKG